MTDAFDTMFPRKPPMTAAEAHEIVAEMQRVTSKRARIYTWKTAIQIANMTDAAKDVYRAALRADGAPVEA